MTDGNGPSVDELIDELAWVARCRYYERLCFVGLPPLLARMIARRRENRMRNRLHHDLARLQYVQALHRDWAATTVETQ